MGDFLRGEDEEAPSFFAFQDVITAVLGILILIALQLSFTINVVHGEKGNETSPVDGLVVSEEEYEELHQRRMELEQRLTILRERNRELLERRRSSEGALLSIDSLISSVEILRAEWNNLRARLADLKATVLAREAILQEQTRKLGLEQTQQRIARLMDELETQERENESLERQLRDLRSEVSNAKAELSSESRKRNSIWMIPERDPDGKNPLLVTVDGRNVRFEEFDKPESLKVLSSRSLTDSFDAGVKGCSPRNYKINFLFKPSGAKYFEKIIDLAKDKGFQVGYDPIEESQEILFSLPD